MGGHKIFWPPPQDLASWVKEAVDPVKIFPLQAGFHAKAGRSMSYHVGVHKGLKNWGTQACPLG